MIGLLEEQQVFIQGHDFRDTYNTGTYPLID